MHYRTLGRTGLKVSLVSFGTGGPSNLGQRTGLSSEGQEALLRRCLDLGINLFDTSAAYSESESILGRSLDGVPRDSYLLATKWVHKDGAALREPEELTRSVENSLRSLRTDYIDVMQFHGVVPPHYHELVERLYPEMARLREQGKVRHIGLSEQFTEDPAHRIGVVALEAHPELWDTIMLKYGILNQVAADEVFPLALEHDVGIINMAAVRVKLPNPKLLEEQIAEWKDEGLVPSDGLPERDPLGWLVHDDVDSVVGAGYKFAADHPAVSTVLTGTSSIDHLEENVAALDNPALAESDSERLKALFGKIAQYA